MQRVKVPTRLQKQKRVFGRMLSAKQDVSRVRNKIFNPKPAIEGIGSAQDGQGTQATEDNRE
jgi:hypothetical protein